VQRARQATSLDDVDLSRQVACNLEANFVVMHVRLVPRARRHGQKGAEWLDALDTLAPAPRARRSAGAAQDAEGTERRGDARLANRIVEDIKKDGVMPSGRKAVATPRQRRGSG
jgi:hypothetical protein